MDLETLKALAQVAGYPLAACILAWHIGPPVGKAISAKAIQWRAHQAGKAVEQLNGQLVAKVSQGLEAQQRAMVDTRLHELGIRDKQEETCERLERVETKQGEQGEALARIEGILGGRQGLRRRG